MKLALHVDRSTWDAALAQTPAALQQDWSYGAALEAVGAQVIRAGVERDGELVALAQMTTRRFGGVVSMGLVTRGPVWLTTLSPDEKRTVIRLIKSGLGLRWPRATLVTPDDVEALPGFSRVMTGYSTVLLDLEQPSDTLRAGFDGKWRNRLVAAEKAGLKVTRNGAKLAQYRWLLDTEEGQRRERGYKATPAALVPEFVEAAGDRDRLLILRADEAREKIAAMMFLVHGCAATYHIGWNSEAGRKLGAHNLLLWQALEHLQARGVRQLDLGGVETVRSAGLARFKIGTGGRVITYAGTFF